MKNTGNKLNFIKLCNLIVFIALNSCTNKYAIIQLRNYDYHKSGVVIVETANSKFYFQRNDIIDVLDSCKQLHKGDFDFLENFKSGYFDTIRFSINSTFSSIDVGIPSKDYTRYQYGLFLGLFGHLLIKEGRFIAFDKERNNFVEMVYLDREYSKHHWGVYFYKDGPLVLAIDPDK